MNLLIERHPRLWLVLATGAGAALGFATGAIAQHPLLLLAIVPLAGVLAWVLARRLPWAPWRRKAPAPYGQMRFASRREERRYTAGGQRAWAVRWARLRTHVRRSTRRSP